MKILLTGTPGIGKSTILEKVKDSFSGPKFGVIAKEIRDENNQRVGFAAINQSGKKETFAHTTDITSDYVVGNKYFVDLNVINNFVVPELERGVNDPESLIFVDEIGRMQAFSNKFLETVRKVLNSNSNVLATVVFDPLPWSIEFKEHKDVMLVAISEDNRSLMPELLHKIFENSSDFHKLKRSQQQWVTNLSREYFGNKQYTQILKLFKNAIPYIARDNVIRIDKNNFEVKGNTNTHIVSNLKEGFKCDCDLFNGRGKYAGEAGECAHVQAVQLFEIA